MADLSFTTLELMTLRVALMSAYYSAAEEERTLREQLDLGHYEDADHEKALAIGRVEAALRMHRYLLLAERVMAAAKPDTPSDQGVLRG